MRSSFTVIALPAIAAVALLVAPPATADNNSYLSAVGDLGELVGGPAGLLQVGKGSCSLLKPHGVNYMFGIAPNPVADMVWQNNPMLERSHSVRIVNAAIDNLCPNPNAFGYAS